eukprot:scaffold6067_cov112-Isochrysis_galbana.AAC.16
MSWTAVAPITALVMEAKLNSRSTTHCPEGSATQRTSYCRESPRPARALARAREPFRPGLKSSGPAGARICTSFEDAFHFP